MNSIYYKVMCLVENETTKISQKAYDVLDAEGIADIIEKDGVFWFESYIQGNNCPDYIYDYLIKFVKRKLKLKYLYDEVKTFIENGTPVSGEWKQIHKISEWGRNDDFMKATNILWDIDYEKDLENLPTEIEIPNGMTDEDEISDYISVVTGFCHSGFELDE